MPIDSFFHEIAFRESNAARGAPPFREPFWQRLGRRISPTMRRVAGVALTLALIAAGGWQHRRLGEYVRSSPRHRPGAADSLAAVVHHTPTAERFYRLALSCARENDVTACARAVHRLAGTANPALVLACLKLPEIRALRVNVFFDELAADLEKHYGSSAPSALSSSPDQAQ